MSLRSWGNITPGGWETTWEWFRITLRLTSWPRRLIYQVEFETISHKCHFYSMKWYQQVAAIEIIQPSAPNWSNLIYFCSTILRQQWSDLISNCGSIFSLSLIEWKLSLGGKDGRRLFCSSIFRALCATLAVRPWNIKYCNISVFRLFSCLKT